MCGRHVRLETCALTGTGLLLHWLDLHDFILELGQEEVDDLVLLDWQRVQIDPVALPVSMKFHLLQCQAATHSSIDFILPAFTRRPSLVLEIVSMRAFVCETWCERTLAAIPVITISLCP